MVTKKTKWLNLSLILLAALLLSACGNAKDGTDEKLSSQSASSSSVTSASYDTSQASATTEPEFSGNDDYFSYAEQIPYENGDGITFELLSEPYKIGNSYENLGVRVANIDETLYILDYAPFLNIDKKINGEWVRLEIDFGDNAKANGSADEVGRNRRNELLNQYSVYNMFDCEITPVLTAGEYRFVAYIAVGKGNTEIRQYYIPFEVTE